MKENEIYIEILKIQNDLGITNNGMAAAMGISYQTFKNKKSLRSDMHFNTVELQNLKEHLKEYVKTL